VLHDVQSDRGSLRVVSGSDIPSTELGEGPAEHERESESSAMVVHYHI